MTTCQIRPLVVIPRISKSVDVVKVKTNEAIAMELELPVMRTSKTEPGDWSELGSRTVTREAVAVGLAGRRKVMVKS